MCKIDTQALGQAAEQQYLELVDSVLSALCCSPSTKLATLMFQMLAVLSGLDVTGPVSRVTGAQAMNVAGIKLWPKHIHAFCSWGSRAVLECA